MRRWILAAAVPLSGMLSLLLMTRWGIGTSPDAVRYIRSARQLVGSIGALSDGGGEAAMVQHAPFYSWLLGVGGLAGMDPIEGARWLNVVLFGLNVALVGFLVRQSTRHAAWLWAVGSMLMLASPILIVHATALSEPVFLSSSLLGFYCLARYLHDSRQRFLFGAALAIGSAFLSRYAGAACVIAGALALAALNTGGLHRRVRDVLSFGFLSSTPMIAWMAGNVAVAGTATGREFVFHPVGRSHAWQGLYTVSSWLHIPDFAPDSARFAVWLALAAGAAVVSLRRSDEPAPGRDPNPAGRRDTGTLVVAVLILFIAVYALFLAASISFFDANTPLDDRILSPVYAAGVVILLHWIDRVWPLVHGRPILAGASLAVVVALAGGHLAKSARLVAAGYAGGWGFSSLAWQQSPTIADVRDLPEATLIYSNAPEIVYLHTGRSARTIPRTRFLMNDQPNLAFPTQLKDVEEALEANCGVVVYFRSLTGQRAVASEQELRDRLRLNVRSENRDGAILSTQACRR